jgi:hypothetical protein
MDVMINLVVGLIGALVGGLITWAIEIRRRRVEATLSLYGEFNTHEMIEIRHLAAEMADSYPNGDFRELRENHGRVAMKEIWVVENYFQRLWLLIQHRQVDRRLIPDLFGDRLAWWVHHHYESRLFMLDTAYARDIEALWRWMETATPASIRAEWGTTT